MLNLNKISSAIIAATIAVSNLTFAQSLELEEIIVTASKRQQTLQEVSVAVSVVSKAEIEQAQIRDIIDLQSVVPSLRVVQLQNSTSTDFFIRGFGNGSTNVGIESSVGVFIDGVYRSRSASQLSDLPNLERVEVLRGPQSTLFGKNASAGVVSVVTSKPSFERQGNIELGVNNYSGRELKGYLSNALSENWAYSVGGSYSKRDGFVNNIVSGEDINERDRFALRGQFLFNANDTSEVRVIVDYDEIDELCCYSPNVVNGPTGAAILALGGQVMTDPFAYETALNFDPENTAKNYGVSLHFEKEFTGFDFTSITSHRNTDSTRNSDVDFTSADILGSTNQQLELETLTQEVRLTSNGTGRLGWLVGGFYFDEDVAQSDDITFGTDFRPYLNTVVGSQTLFNAIELLSGNVQGSFFQPGAGSFTSVGQDNRSRSLFGQFDYDVTDAITFTLGLNYTEDKKNAFIDENNTAVFSNTDLFNANFGAIPQALFGLGFLNSTGLQPTQRNILAIETAAPGTVAAIQSGVTQQINGLSALQFTPSLLGFPNAVENGQSKDNNLDYSIRLSYELSDELNLYVSHGTGFKATSWNLSRDSRPTRQTINAVYPNATSIPFNLTAGTRFADPEESSIFEVGLKVKFDTASFNLTVFDQSIENFQTQSFIGTAFSLVNAEEQSSKGIELDAQWYASPGLKFTLGAAYIDSTYDVFTNSPSGDISGTKVGNVNQYSATLATTYNWSIGRNDLFLRMDYQYESEVETEDGGALNSDNAVLLINGVGERDVGSFNAAFGISYQNVDFSIWVRNLTNDQYITQNFPTPLQSGSFNGYANAPRTYGLNARYKF